LTYLDTSKKKFNYEFLVDAPLLAAMNDLSNETSPSLLPPMQPITPLRRMQPITPLPRMQPITPLPSSPTTPDSPPSPSTPLSSIPPPNQREYVTFQIPSSDSSISFSIPVIAIRRINALNLNEKDESSK